MTILKLTKSGKAVQVIDDDGRVYITSVNFVQGLLMGKSKFGFIKTKRLPFNVSKDRFEPSELYDPDGIYKGNAAKTFEKVTTTNDPLSVKSREDKKQKKNYEEIDWN